MEFKRLANAPFISRQEGSFHSRLVANPDLLEFKNNFYLFFRGQGESGHDQIGVLTKPVNNADGLSWDETVQNPIIPVSDDPISHDSDHILDPAAIEFNDSIYLYYTAKSKGVGDNYSIALAISSDGTHYKKYSDNPVMNGVIAPEVILHEGLLHLFFQRHNQAGDYWEVFARTSKDGINFPEATEKKVFSPSRLKGEIDSHSVATIRIFKESDHFYMTYGACQKFLDYPESIGLARSKNLFQWETYPNNPIFTRGEPGDWDEGAVWFPTVHKIGNKYLMWYEGAGTGLLIDSDKSRQASDQAREENYGGYLTTSFSQIGVATLDESLFTWQ